MAKTANIFDPIQKELDQKVFNGINPRPRVVKFVEDEMRKVLAPLLGFDPTEFMDIYLTGSLTTYQYDETSDFDVSVFIQWDLWPTGEDPNTIRRKIIPFVMDKLDGSLVPGTQHPIQHFVVPPGARVEDMYKPGLRSAWSFRDHKWLVPPEKDRVHDVSVELPVLYHRAEMMADKMEELLAYNPIYAKEFWHQVHRKRQMDQKAGKGDFSEGNIVYKYLLHNGYFDRIRDELGERISKVAVGLPGESYWPGVGEIWTVADPWAKTRTPSGPDRYTVEIIAVDDDDIWVRDVDSKAERSWPLYTWQRWMDTGRVWQSNQNWQLNESPEEATDLWPDTLPDNWSKVAAPTPEDYARGLYLYAVKTLTPQELFSWMARTLAADLKMSIEESRVLAEHVIGQAGDWHGALESKTADDLGWVERKYPGDTGAINAPDHSSEDPIGDQPTSLPPRDVPAMDNLPNEKSFKVIYDYEKDQIILGDIRVADKYPPGQIIGEYKHDDVVLNDNVDAWLNPKYFKRLWQHSFPKRPLKSIILDKGDGQHEVVHRPDTLRS